MSNPEPGTGFMTGFTLGCASKNDQPRIKSRTSNAAGEGGRAPSGCRKRWNRFFWFFSRGVTVNVAPPPL